MNTTSNTAKQPSTSSKQLAGKKKQPKLVEARFGWGLLLCLSALLLSGAGYYYYSTEQGKIAPSERILNDAPIVADRFTKSVWRKASDLSNNLRKTVTFSADGKYGLITSDVLGTLKLSLDGGETWGGGGYIGYPHVKLKENQLPSVNLLFVQSTALTVEDGFLYLSAVIQDANLVTSMDQFSSNKYSFIYTGRIKLDLLNARSSQAGEGTLTGDNAWEWSITPMGVQSSDQATTVRRELVKQFKDEQAVPTDGLQDGEPVDTSGFTGEENSANQAAKNTKEHDDEGGPVDDPDNVLASPVDPSGRWIVKNVTEFWERREMQWVLKKQPMPEGRKAGPPYMLLNRSVASSDGQIKAMVGYEDAIRFENGKWKEFSVTNKYKIDFQGGIWESNQALLFGNNLDPAAFVVTDDTTNAENVVAGGLIYFSTDSGATWNRSSVTLKLDSVLSAVRADKDYFFAVAIIKGRGCIIRSVDGGNSFLLDYADTVTSFTNIAVGAKRIVAIENGGSVFFTNKPV